MAEITAGQVTLFIALFAAISGAFWRIWSLIKDARHEASLKAEAAGAKADLVGVRLHEHQLYAAETFATKHGVTEQMVAIAKAVTDVGERVEKRFDSTDSRFTQMNERLDRVIEAAHKPIPRRN